MELIDKVITKIKEMLNKEYPCDNSEQEVGYASALYELEDFIDTLEVNEVDLEKEVRKYVQENFTIDEEQLDRFGIEEKDYMYSMDESDMLSMAKYFYKLGLKLKGE